MSSGDLTADMVFVGVVLFLLLVGFLLCLNWAVDVLYRITFEEDEHNWH